MHTVSTLPNMQAATGTHGANPKSDIRIIASTKKINRGLNLEVISLL